MKTFNFSLKTTGRIVVPDQFIADMRAYAQSDNAGSTPFLRVAQEQFPEDDEGFILMVLKNGVRATSREHLIAQLTGSGLGGTVSPYLVELTGIPQEIVGFEAVGIPELLPAKDDAVPANPIAVVTS